MNRRGLYLLVDSQALPPAQWPRLVPPVLDAGPVLVQFRAKTETPEQRRSLAAQLLCWCRDRGLPLLINDAPELCAELGADGVHLGAADPALAAARQQLGPEALIGLSCYADLHRARAGELAGADYLSFGRVYPSRTKPEAPPLPNDFLPRARREIEAPLCAIGGIGPENAGPLLATGVDLLCVAGGIWSAADPPATAAALAAHCARHFSAT